MAPPDDEELRADAAAYLRGKELPFAEVDALWRHFKKDNDLALARSVLARMRQGLGLIDELPRDPLKRLELCQQEAILTSKDSELLAANRHDTALKILGTPGIGGLLGYANRSMGMLMERVRLATFADLTARLRSGLLRGLMFQHMKAGLDAHPIRLKFSQESYELKLAQLTPAGIRKDFQKALSELRTDLDVFSPEESNALMACGYQMTRWAFQRQLSQLKGLADQPISAKWVFEPTLAEITSTRPGTVGREALLQKLQAGKATKL